MKYAAEEHTHNIKYWPYGGLGFAVCACGATRRIENSKPYGEWHSCQLCVEPNYETERVEEEDRPSSKAQRLCV